MHRCPSESIFPMSFSHASRTQQTRFLRISGISTKSKTNNCPNCDFTTVDPGSLTRHRKRIHGYIPKTRRSRHPKPSITTASVISSLDPGDTSARSRTVSDHNRGEGSSALPMHQSRAGGGTAQLSVQPQPLLSNESISRTNFNQAPISRFITTLSSSTSTSAPLPTTTKRVTIAQMEDEVGTKEVVERARTSEVMSSFRRSVSLGKRNFEGVHYDRDTPGVKEEQNGKEDNSSILSEADRFPDRNGNETESRDGNSGLVSVPG
ncbi:hypothetical protein J3R30DRAFT_3470175 [Lentinula aciculospora]|uniref:C2H2-type domain-containing protein n=1 Tax=Lentinula aciculospora TaxID=153920 RepID=A0A9W9ADL0_9AGAR|nr:hypothetical protein J3R30DRAFT_3470175 [Lentinula aciculospora]